MPGKKYIVDLTSEERTMPDFAECMRLLVDDLYPDAERIRVVLDNLNTHKPASLYATFPLNKPIVYSNASNSITPLNTAHGSIWRKSSLAFLAANA